MTGELHEHEAAGSGVAGMVVEGGVEGYDAGPDDSQAATEPVGAEGAQVPAPGPVEGGGPGEARALASTREAQHLLAGVGFPVAADGVAGASTRQAVTWFQESWTRSSLAVDGVWGPATEAAVRACVADARRISDHFTLPEFACAHCHWPRANRALVRGLEAYRGKFFAAGGLAIVSGYRCVAHNTAIGGAKGSQHLYGRAANVPPHGDGGKLVTVEAVQGLRLFAGLEYQPAISGRGCTHVDVRAGGSVTSPSIFAW